ncbi:MAG: ABC transporter ATP-binding protein [Gemmatimonadota bacterium]|nr:ABC transporter ATP-binding protein [Gemmatimonadota bacterium]|tara:strand:- start:3437 stop:4147 length:711 start_codon:yes stop_codon:yes gene_type:complete
MKSQIILEAHDLSKVYDMGEVRVRALRSVDLKLYCGELAVLLGASGSGKSTLLNILGGLDRPTSGTLKYKDHDLSYADDEELTEYRRQSVGFVFQLYNLIPSLTARENVSLVSEIAVRPMLPEEALEMVGLGDRLDHFPAQLSGGEQQRVAIARAVAKQPEILLCDEPTGALDAQTGKLVLSVLEKVNRETETTTAIITHNVAIGGLGDRVIRMSSGEVTELEINERRVSLDEVEW